jgi:hypothetical protein
MNDWHNGAMQRASEEIYGALRRLGYEPTGKSFAESESALRKQSAQWRLRQDDEAPKSMEEVEWALMEALIIQGSCQVWRGDGLSCAAQIVWAQHRRAGKAKAEIVRLRVILERARTILGNMALEHPPDNGWSFYIRSRWPISHEPLRADAKGLLPVINEALGTEQLAGDGK